MWHVITAAEEQAARDRAVEDLLRRVEEARRKEEARRAHRAATHCPRCGRSDPLPPWLR